MTEIRSPDRGAHPFDYNHEDWWDQLLDGKPSSLPANRVSLGFFARRLKDGTHIGIAIWEENGRPVVKVAYDLKRVLVTEQEEEDFCTDTLARCAAIPEEAYLAWAANGVWPEGVSLDRPKPSRPKPAPRSKPSPPVEAPVAHVEILPAPDIGNMIVRVYATIDPPSPAMAFMSRAIVRTKGGEGFSVCLYADTAGAATERAHAWIAAERKRQEPPARRAAKTPEIAATA